MARVDPAFAKNQLLLFMREWYMHPNGQLPAFEYDLSNVDPPVHAYACWRVYKIGDENGSRDVGFLERAFQKLLLNFTWWVNRQDLSGRNVFSGGFLGLDNIGVFDRSLPMPGYSLEQLTGPPGWVCTARRCWSWPELAAQPSHEDIASKFFEHFAPSGSPEHVGWHGPGMTKMGLLRTSRSATARCREGSLIGGWIPACRGGAERGLTPHLPRSRSKRLVCGYRKDVLRQVAS
jgi:hypothetical protein